MAQQDKFIIGAEHVSSFHDFWDTSGIPHTGAYWDTVKSLGLNYAGLKYFEQYSGYGNATVDQIRADIAKARSDSIEVYLTNGFDRYDAAGDIYSPKRWLYQIENPSNILNGNNIDDFLTVTGGTVLHDSSASAHWNFAPDLSHSAPNFLRLTPGNPPDPPYGIVASHLRVKDLQPDNLNYYIKVKMRLPNAINFPGIPVARVSVSLSGTSVGRTILASEFTDRKWKEIYVTSYKKSTAPNVYDIQIEWYDTKPYNFTVDLDYVAIDDTVAKRLYDGEFDARVGDFVTHYHDVVRNLVVWDEPKMENLFPIQRYDSILGGARPTRGPLTYWASRPQKDGSTKRFLYESRMPVLMADLYPIPWYNPLHPKQLFTIPGDAGYTDALQARLQNAYVDYLPDLISNAQLFNKPFWLTVQVSSWALPGEMTLREPSAYEIRAMVNLGVCYGAKGINYFMYTNNSTSGQNRAGLLQNDSGSSTPRYTDVYGQPKWQTVKELNHNLKAIGGELLLLTWLGAKSWHNGASTGAWSDFVTSVATNVSGETEYIETGHFRNASNADYLFVVNRRTSFDESRDIFLSLKHIAKEWRVFIEGTVDTSLTSDSGVLAKSFAPGEGKLIKILQEGPDTPQNIAASSYGGDQHKPAHAKVSWSKNIPSLGLQRISGYEIYRSTQQDSPGTIIVATSAADSFYVDTGVNAGDGGMTFYYTMKAKDITALHSGYSAQVSIGSSN